MSDWSWVQSIPDWVKYANGFLVGLFVSYLTSYMRESGKIRAQTESLAKVTRIVEDTRREYLHEIERLRNDLIILREEMTSVRKQGREAVVSFLEKANVFLHEFLERSRPVRGKDEHNFLDFLDNYIHILEKHIAELDMAQIRLFVYFHEKKNIVEAANAVISSAGEASTALRSKAAEALSMRRTFKNIGTSIPEDLRTTITPKDVQAAMGGSMIKKEKELDANIDASCEKFRLAVSEFTEKTRSFFEQIYQESVNRS